MKLVLVQYKKILRKNIFIKNINKTMRNILKARYIYLRNDTSIY